MEETAEQRRQRIRSLYIVHTSILIYSMGGSIIITGVWPYLQALDNSISMNEFGFVVAADALGQMIFSPILGYIADRLKSVRALSLACSLIFSFGGLCYSSIALIPKSVGSLKQARLLAMLLTRFIVGIGTAIVAPNRIYVSKASLLEERTTHIALLSLFQTLGFILGPAVQAALSPIGEGEGPIPDESTFHFDMYTACGFVSAATGVISFALYLPCLFREFSVNPLRTAAASEGARKAAVLNRQVSRRSLKNQKPKELLKQYSRISIVNGTKFALDDEDDDLESRMSFRGMSFWEAKKPDALATMACIFTFFAVLLNYALTETTSTPIVMDQWGWSREEAVRYLGITMAAGGLIGGTCFALIGPLAKRFDERKLLVFAGLVPLVVGKIVVLPMGREYPPIYQNVTIGDEEGSWEIMLGCKYEWCKTVPKITYAQYYVGVFLTNSGFPFCMALTASIFSKLLTGIPQGFWMGVLTMSGSLSRVLGPIFVSFVYQSYGVGWTNGSVLLVLGAAFVLNLVAYKRLAFADDDEDDPGAEDDRQWDQQGTTVGAVGPKAEEQGIPDHGPIKFISSDNLDSDSDKVGGTDQDNLSVVTITHL